MRQVSGCFGNKGRTVIKFKWHRSGNEESHGKYCASKASDNHRKLAPPMRRTRAGRSLPRRHPRTALA
eukprot:3227024-Pyramimonas_sp.AAC.1